MTKVTKAKMRGPKVDRFDRRVIHSVLTPSADSDLAFIKSAYHALTLRPVNQSQVVRRALNCLAERLVGLYGQDAAKAEIEALEGERVSLKAADLTAKLRNNTATVPDLQAALKLLQDTGTIGGSKAGGGGGGGGEAGDS